MDRRSYFKKQLTDCPFWIAYGARGMTPSLHRLSAYEFHRHYVFHMVKYPRSKSGHKQALLSGDEYQTRLTEASLNKVDACRGVPTLIADLDYQIIEEGDEWWHPLGTGEKVQEYRYDWVIGPRLRPYVPVVYGAQGNNTEEEQALRIFCLFFPWVNDFTEIRLLVPYNGHFREPGMISWLN
ncbi:ATP-dependent DNA helicase [Durusdinium trenchii]|uniref:ATP-dependent DNA helicase n=1 Tax=Durusdinium trenchii TaxID=1381693 RepID=A0ABP0I716_9DINO